MNIVNIVLIESKRKGKGRDLVACMETQALSNRHCALYALGLPAGLGPPAGTCMHVHEVEVQKVSEGCQEFMPNAALGDAFKRVKFVPVLHN